MVFLNSTGCGESQSDCSNVWRRYGLYKRSVIQQRIINVGVEKPGYVVDVEPVELAIVKFHSRSRCFKMVPTVNQSVSSSCFRVYKGCNVLGEHFSSLLCRP